MPSKRPEPLGKRIGQSETEAGRIKDEYDLSNFYISSTDKHHNNERLRVNKENNTIRVPTFVWALVAKWVDEDQTPYRSAADLVRDAVVHRIHQLQELADAPPDATWRGMRLQAEMYRKVAEATRYKESVAAIKQMMSTAWSDGDIKLYNELHADAKQLVEEIPSPHKDDLESYLRDQKNIRRLNAAE